MNGTEIMKRNFRLVDENGFIREISVTVEHSPGILIAVGFPAYIDEGGILRKVIGIEQSSRPELERAEMNNVRRVNKNGKQRDSQAGKA